MSFLRAVSVKNCSRAAARHVLSALGDPACWPPAACLRSCSVAADHAQDGSAPGRPWASEQFCTQPLGETPVPDCHLGSSQRANHTFSVMVGGTVPPLTGLLVLDAESTSVSCKASTCPHVGEFRALLLKPTREEACWPLHSWRRGGW